MTHILWTDPIMLALKNNDLEQLEANVRRAIRTGDESALFVLGYGEITTVLLLDTDDGSFALKRLPVVKSRENAEHVAETIHAYVDRLRAAGVNVVPNEARIVEDSGEFVVYCCQHALPIEALAVNWFHAHKDEEIIPRFERIIDTIAHCVSPELTTDGQLSNWAFVDNDLLYVDVSTPFLRHPDGSSVLDWRNYMGPIPAPLRWYYLREVPKVLDTYFDLRRQIVDLLGNLRKEKLDHLTPVLTEIANDRFEFEQPISIDEVREYYNNDAKMYALVARLRKFDRWVHRRILWKPYPYLLAPDVERNLY